MYTKELGLFYNLNIIITYHRLLLCIVFPQIASTSNAAKPRGFLLIGQRIIGYDFAQYMGKLMLLFNLISFLVDLT